MPETMALASETRDGLWCNDAVIYRPFRDDVMLPLTETPSRAHEQLTLN
ncbi:hypothetical protein [Hoeflea ulvae]|uniref:Uncharacterized protein n=1 Tax=Hoeflea ulvae TaxID=2983764 RepID=A0ABT3YM42_9HYPH|nr:hypothetical protein [Hoeflea ulvae]MCY0096854.1 hypothetical protein [Hoeflea ulvae]